MILVASKIVEDANEIQITNNFGCVGSFSLKLYLTKKIGKKKCFQHLKRDWERDDIAFPPPNFSLSSGEPRCSYLTLLISRFVGLNVIYCPTISQTIRKFAPHVIRVPERGWNSLVLPSSQNRTVKPSRGGGESLRLIFVGWLQS